MALFGRGNRDVDTILKRLESKSFRSPAEKRELLQQLAEIELRADTLLKFLTGGDAELARFAVGRAGHCRDGRLLDQLLSALQRAPRGTTRILIDAIHKMKSPRLGDRLGQILRGHKPEARAVALEVLAADPDWKQHLALVKHALRDDEGALRVRAVRILGNAPRDPGIRSLLKDLMHATHEDARHAALEVLAKDPTPDLIEDFFELLPNQPSRLQDTMIRGLKRMLAGGAHSERVLQHIMPLLAAEDEAIRAAAAQLLASMPDKLYVLRRFFQYAKGIAFWLRDRAFGAISAIASDVTEAILQLLQDEDIDVVVGAVAMSGGSKDLRLVEGLRGVLTSRHDWWIKIPALVHLAGFEHPGVVPILVERLGDPELANGAIAGLGRRADPATLPHLLPFLRHERMGLRRAALDALAHFRGEPDVMAAVERVARTDPDQECRHVALEMLDESGVEGVAMAEAIRNEHRHATPGAADDLQLTMLADDANA